MPLKYIPSRKGIGEASVLAVADPLIEQAAQQILERAREIAESEKLSAFAESLRVDSGTRPRGRGYREVIADTPDGEALEWGDDSTERRRILGQAAGVQVNVRGDVSREKSAR